MEYTGELVVDDPDGIVVDACFVDRRRCAGHLAQRLALGGRTAVASGWPSRGRASAPTATTWPAPTWPRWRSPAGRPDRCRPGQVVPAGHADGRARHPARRHGRLLRVGRAASTTPSCAAGRWWSVAPVTGAWWRPPPTRPGPSASTRPCRRCGPGGCAPRPCSCTVATTATARSAARSWRSSARSPRWSSPSRSTRPSSTCAPPGGCTVRPPRIAADIRRRVHDEVGLTCSVGVAPSKFVAKLASEAAKPRASVHGPQPGLGVKVVGPDEVLGFLRPAAGVGAVGGRPGHPGPARAPGRDHRRRPGRPAGRRSSPPRWARRPASHLHALANGIDDRAVEPERPAQVDRPRGDLRPGPPRATTPSSASWCAWPTRWAAACAATAWPAARSRSRCASATSTPSPARAPGPSATDSTQAITRAGQGAAGRRSTRRPGCA